MKKILSAFLFTFYVFFAVTSCVSTPKVEKGQPFFLKNWWIIPEDTAWGEVYRVPPRKGVTQTKGNTEGLDFVEINYLIQMPPYFVENKIANWKMHYSELLESMAKQKEFAVYTRPYFRQKDNKFSFSKTVVAVYKANSRFMLRWDFPWSETDEEFHKRQPHSFSIRYSKEKPWYLPNEDSDPFSVLEWMWKNKNTKAESWKDIEKLDDDAVDFYNQNSWATWYYLSELERYAVAFSCNLFMMNNQYPLDYTGRTKLNKDYSEPAEILRDSWGITDGTSLRNKLYDLEGYGHSGAYKKLCALLDKYPDKSPFEIGNLEYLSVLDMTRLLYVKDTRKYTGSHGIEAWDEGRMITLVRWALGCGYIDIEEANRLIEPIVQRIKQNYSEMGEYIIHYTIGRGFCFLNDGSSLKAIGDAIGNFVIAHAYVPFSLIKFSGENSGEKANGKYMESKEFKKWMAVQKLSQEQLSLVNFQMLKDFEKEYSAYPNLFIEPHFCMLTKYGTPEEAVRYFETHSDYFEANKTDESKYADAMRRYLALLNKVSRAEDVLSLYKSFSSNKLRNDVVILYQYAYANYLMLDYTSSDKEYDSYKSTARDVFLSIKKAYLKAGKEVDLGDEIEKWLEDEN